jgi:hypothetical protein
MKKTPSPRNFPKQNFNLQHEHGHGHARINTNNHNHRTTLEYVKVAAKKVAGVFTKLFFRRRKANSQHILISDSTQNNAQMRVNPCKFSDFILLKRFQL